MPGNRGHCAAGRTRCAAGRGRATLQMRKTHRLVIQASGFGPRLGVCCVVLKASFNETIFALSTIPDQRMCSMHMAVDTCLSQ